VTLDVKADVGGRAAKQPAKQSAKQAKQYIYMQSASKAGRGMPPLQLHPLVALADQCKHKFLLHLDGISDGASLKYKLACGSVVIVVRSPNEEFYHHALFRRLDNPEAGSSGGDPKGSPGGLTQRSGHGRPSSHVVVSVEPPPPRFFRLLEKRIEPQLRHSLLRNSPRLTPCIYTCTYAYTHTYTYIHIHTYLPELHNCPQLAHARTMHVCIPYASARVILFLSGIEYTIAETCAALCVRGAGNSTLAEIGRALRLLQGSPQADAEAQAIGRRAQRFAREELGQAALSCYWLVALLHYVALYDSDDHAGGRALSTALAELLTFKKPAKPPAPLAAVLDAEIPQVRAYWRRVLSRERPSRWQG